MAITIGLAGLGRSTPDLPLAILGLAAIDLPWRTAAARYAAGAAGVALTTWLASALGLASVAAEAVAVVAVPALVIFAAVLLAAAGRLRRFGGAAVILLLAVAVALSPTPAAAHDPGQGRTVAAVTLTGASDGRGTLTITADIAGDCAALTPDRVVVGRRVGTLDAPHRREAIRSPPQVCSQSLASPHCDGARIPRSCLGTGRFPGVAAAGELWETPAPWRCMSWWTTWSAPTWRRSTPRLPI